MCSYEQKFKFVLELGIRCDLGKELQPSKWAGSPPLSIGPKCCVRGPQLNYLSWQGDWLLIIQALVTEQELRTHA